MTTISNLSMSLKNNHLVASHISLYLISRSHSSLIVGTVIEPKAAYEYWLYRLFLFFFCHCTGYSLLHHLGYHLRYGKST